MTFQTGYALLIGVGTATHSPWSLPMTVNDAEAIRTLFIDPDRCGYLPPHVQVRTNADASRQGILDGLTWLQERAAADPTSTIIFYYSGHGWRDETGEDYYLIPADTSPKNLVGTALADSVLMDALRRIQSARLWVVFDCCHAEGMATAKAVGTVDAPLPKSLIDTLKQGEGRAVFTSCRGTEQSWIHPSGAISIYTHHLLEALQGAGSKPGDTKVRLSHLMRHLADTVPTTAQTLHPPAPQTPFFDTATEDFPVALLMGGKGLVGGSWSHTQAAATATIHEITGALPIPPLTTSGDNPTVNAGNTVHGPNAGRDMDARTITTHDGGYTEGPRTTRTVHTDGGDYAEGNIDKRSTRNQSGGINLGNARIGSIGTMVQGDMVHGDKVLGDKITNHGGTITTGDTINLSGTFSGAVLNIKATLTNTTQTINGMANTSLDQKQDLAQLMDRLSTILAQVPPTHTEDAEAVAECAKELVEKAAKTPPNKRLVQVSAEGLKQAAQHLGGTLPMVPPIAIQIAEVVQQMIRG